MKCMNIKNMFSRKKTVIIVIAVVVIGFLIVLNQKYSKNSAQYQPLSTRGLPPPATDVPVTLPPDPGEAGKLTLAGIDSNNDGVRDDLEREIVYMYPQNNEVRRVLRAMVKKDEEILTTTNIDARHLNDLRGLYLALWSCYNSLLFPEGTPLNYNNLDILLGWGHMFENTKERRQRSHERTQIVSALPQSVKNEYVIKIGSFGNSDACTNPLVKDQY